MRIGEQTEELIMKYSGTVEDTSLRDVLYKATVHFTLIRLADKNSFAYDASYEEYKFDKIRTEQGMTLDDAVEKHIAILHKRLNELDVMAKDIEWAAGQQQATVSSTTVAVPSRPL